MACCRKELVRIGVGSFAEVFVCEGREGVAIKVVKESSRYLELLREFQILESAFQCTAGQTFLFSFPTPSTSLDTFALFRKQAALPHTLQGINDEASLYIMERVWPVPSNLSRAIRERFFPPQHKDYHKGFIARIYLGKRCDGIRDRPRLFFDANNFPLNADSLEELGLPVAHISTEMGRLLARLHIAVRSDARDVEFVLGGDPLHPFTKPKFYCIDFNQVRLINADDGESFVNTIVDAFFVNDPYYPRPFMRFWEEFRVGYLTEASNAVPENCQAGTHVLAEEILEKICRRASEIPYAESHQ